MALIYILDITKISDDIFFENEPARNGVITTFENSAFFIVFNQNPCDEDRAFINTFKENISESFCDI